MVRSGDGNAEDWERAKRQADEHVGSLLGVVKSGVTPTPGDVWMIEPTIRRARRQDHRVLQRCRDVPRRREAVRVPLPSTPGATTGRSRGDRHEGGEGQVQGQRQAHQGGEGYLVQSTAEIEVPDSAFVMDMVFSAADTSTTTTTAPISTPPSRVPRKRWKTTAGSAPPSFTTSSSRTA